MLYTRAKDTVDLLHVAKDLFDRLLCEKKSLTTLPIASDLARRIIIIKSRRERDRINSNELY